MISIVILFHLLGVSFAIPLVAQRLLSASNSNEVLVGLVNPNVAQGTAMNYLVPGVFQQQMQPKIPGLSQVPFGARIGLPAQVPNQMTFNGQIQPLIPFQNEQQPNKIQFYSLYPQKPQLPPTSPKQVGNQPPMEQTFGCLVPQIDGEAMHFGRIPSSGLQLPTKSPDALVLDGFPTSEPRNLEDKLNQPYPDMAKEQQVP
ncbi:odontogenic ameloblast-associated protein [Bombina bombina]|uniref:odontogenic ameloblast-associated protein n=1 Tax=Bombina bombina TaxID=8345 RepID=UPI00235A9739|nr:odontogenic ameloblast-associated protein [Bombina bombina]